MRINPDQVMLDYDGKPVELPTEDGNMEELTLRRVIIQALNSVQPGKPLTAEQKHKAFQISVRCNVGKPLDLKVEDMAFIKERVALAYPSPLIYGRVSEVFDGPIEED